MKMYLIEGAIGSKIYINVKFLIHLSINILLHDLFIYMTNIQCELNIAQNLNNI